MYAENCEKLILSPGFGAFVQMFSTPCAVCLWLATICKITRLLKCRNVLDIKYLTFITNVAMFAICSDPDQGIRTSTLARATPTTSTRTSTTMTSDS